jgi:membrane protein implicated in regulation of membrane protease activity
MFGDIKVGYFSNLLNKLKRGKSLETIVGERAVVVERIDNFAGCGQVKIGGMYFSARGTEENDSFEVGEVLQIVAIEGVKLVCRK